MGYCKTSFPFLNKVFNRDATLSASWNVVLSFLWKRFLRIKHDVAAVYGFKITFDQLEAYPGLFDYLNDHFKIIFLSREDKLRQTLSLVKARITENYDEFHSNPIDFDVNQVLEQHFIIWRWEEKIQKQATDIHSITTEELFNDPKSALRKLLSFLEVDPLDHLLNDVASDRLNPMETEKWVMNYEDIQIPIKEMSWE